MEDSRPAAGDGGPAVRLTLRRLREPDGRALLLYRVEVPDELAAAAEAAGSGAAAAGSVPGGPGGSSAGARAHG